MGGLAIEVSLSHLGGAFHRWWMWLPVTYAPVLMIIAILLAADFSRTMAVVGLVFFGVGVVVGLLGTYFHFRAIGRYVMGYTLRNFVAGPPPLAPAQFFAMSVLGVLTVYWAAYVR